VLSLIAACPSVSASTLLFMMDELGAQPFSALPILRVVYASAAARSRRGVLIWPSATPLSSASLSMHLSLLRTTNSSGSACELECGGSGAGYCACVHVTQRAPFRPRHCRDPLVTSVLGQSEYVPILSPPHTQRSISSAEYGVHASKLYLNTVLCQRFQVWLRPLEPFKLGASHLTPCQPYCTVLPRSSSTSTNALAVQRKAHHYSLTLAAWVMHPQH